MPPSPGGWTWVTGEPFTYTNWSPGQPDNEFGLEHYLHFYAFDPLMAPEWNDLEAARYPIKGYIVEYVPEPTTVWLLGLGGLALLRKRRDDRCGQ